MEIIDTYIIFCLIAISLLVNFYIIKYYLNKKIQTTFSKAIKTEEINFSAMEPKGTAKSKVLRIESILNETVLEIYKEFKENPLDFYLDSHYLLISNINLKVWAKNDVENRDFSVNNDERYSNSFYTSENENRVEELNKSINIYDKILLDKIIRQVKINQQNAIINLLEL